MDEIGVDSVGAVYGVLWIDVVNRLNIYDEAHQFRIHRHFRIGCYENSFTFIPARKNYRDNGGFWGSQPQTCTQRAVMP